jgi:hypothetical protein
MGHLRQDPLLELVLHSLGRSRKSKVRSRKSANLIYRNAFAWSSANMIGGEGRAT